MRLHSVLLYVPNVREVADWYAKHLGLTFIEDAPDGKFSMLKANGGSLLGIHAAENASKSLDNTGLYFAVDDVDAHYERMKDEGCEFVSPPKDQPWGSKMATTRDPAGHCVGIETAITGFQLGEK